MTRNEDIIEISDDCSGACSRTMAYVEDYNKDVTIHSARKTQLNVQTGADIGTTQNIAPADISRNAMRLFRNYFRGFTYKESNCSAGCYCDGSGGISYQEKTVTETLTFSVDELRTRGSTKKNIGDNQRTVQEQVESGQRILIDGNGKPVTFDPQRDVVGSIMLNCCGELAYDFSIDNQFRYEINFEAKLKLATDQGECKDLGIIPEGGAIA